MPGTHLTRRAFVVGTLAGLGGLFTPAVAADLRKNQKRAVLVWMAGGPSQLETWDPKPDTVSAGPHKTIPTAVPGVHFDEFLPRLARRADRMAVVRTVTARSAEHAQATFQGFTGAAPGTSPTPPNWLSACAHELAADPDLWPAVVTLGRADLLTPTAGGGFLGPRYDPVPCPGGGKPPAGLPKTPADDEAVRRRDALRDALASDFRYGHDEARLAAHDAAFGNIGRLLARRDLFDISREPLKRTAAYGDTPIGRDCLLACRLVERGVPFVQVVPGDLPWDMHVEMAKNQQKVTAPFDTAVGALVDDLIARGLWEHTLVVLAGEFGRTPGNLRTGGGRDHWAKNWAVSFGGAGVTGGAVVGRTSADGREIADRPVTVPDLLATFYAALGVDPRKEFETPAGPVQLLERGRGKALADLL